MRHGSILLAALLCTATGLLPGCTEERSLDLSDLPAGAQAISLAGDTLYPPPLSAEVQKDREAKLAQARADYERDPYDADAFIWLGRRTAYLGEYRAAIDIYSEGIG